MNSYNFGLNGSLWLLVLLVIVSTAFTLYTYRRTTPEISKGRRVLLICLRSIALFLLLFVLFEPILSRVFGSFEQPKLNVLMDNSISAGITDSKQNRKDTYKKIFTDANLNSLESENTNYFLFDEKTFKKQKLTFDSLKFNGFLTDITQAARFVNINTANENTQAYLMVTDGNFNKGESPIQLFDQIGKPVFIFGVGDTTQPKDVAITSLLLNEIVFLNTVIPINVNINSYGLDKSNAKVKLLDNEKVISEQAIDIKQSQSNYSLIFNYPAKQEGNHKISAQIEGIDGEITLKNNVKNEFIKVLKNKKNIAIFAGSPSSDYSFIKNIFNKEDGVLIKNYVQITGSKMLETPNAKDLQESELIILIGFPNQYTDPRDVATVCEQLEKGKPLLFIASQDLAYNKFGKLNEYLPYKTTYNSGNEMQVFANVLPQQLSSSILKITGSENDIKEWNNLPPIFKTESFVQLKDNAQAVMFMKFNNTAVNEPIVISRNISNKKVVSILAYGLYNWKLSGYAREVSKGNSDTYDLMTIFFENIYKYLSIEQENKQFKITTNKSHYSQNEKVDFIAQLYDANYSPLDNANINVKITNGKDTRDLVLTNIGSGRYEGNVSSLLASDYYFSADALVNQNKIASESGRFSVGNESIENENLTMNYKLLQEIAKRTGGKFYFPSEASNFQNDLKNLKNFIPKPIVQKDEINLWNSTLILLISIVLFGTEWLLRKIFGLI